MNITISSAKLTETLDLVTRFVSRHATLPILENIYIKGDIDKLLLKGTDMEKHIEMSVPATISNEGAITINAKTLMNIVKTIDEDEIQLIVNQEKDTMTVKTTKDKFVIKGIPSTEYVALPEIQNDTSLDIDAQSLITGIEKVEYTVSEKNFSPVLTGVYMRTQKESGQHFLIFVGSDSFRLAEYKIPVTQDIENMKVIIPKVNIGDLQKVFEFYVNHQGQDITINFSENMIGFKCQTEDGIEILATSLLIQGNFPDYNNENIIPTQFQSNIVVEKASLEKSIKKILIMTRDINNYVLLENKDNTLSINSGDTDKGEAMTQIAALTNGETHTIGINGKYISDFLKNTRGDEIIINIVDNQKPLAFKDPTDDNYTYVARPLLK